MSKLEIFWKNFRNQSRVRTKFKLRRVLETTSVLTKSPISAFSFLHPSDALTMGGFKLSDSLGFELCCLRLTIYAPLFTVTDLPSQGLAGKFSYNFQKRPVASHNLCSFYIPPFPADCLPWERRIFSGPQPKKWTIFIAVRSASLTSQLTFEMKVFFSLRLYAFAFD